MTQTSNHTPTALQRPQFIPFYNHPFIQKISTNPKWSVSNKEKCPIDMYRLRYRGDVIGCDPAVPYSMTTLMDTLQILPDPSNHAYYLNAPDEDDFVILDIEPKCPSSLKHKFMQLPYIYAEKSLSGQGIHLVMPMPSNYRDFPVAMTKTKLQEEHKWYEILVNHWVTFTRNMMPPAKPTLTLKDWDDVYAELASVQKASAETVNFQVNGSDTSDIPEAEWIIDLMVGKNPFMRTAADYHNDMSRFEYALLSFKCRKIISLTHSSKLLATGHQYTPDELTRLLYAVALQTVPYRAKHDQYRNHMPWLMSLSRKVVGDQLNQL